MDIRKYNQIAWDNEVKKGNKWTVPVSTDVVKQARAGNWRVHLTPTISVPKDWFPPLSGLDVLCLASGGGQQGPTLAAAGANVTVLDNSPMQLEGDRRVAERDSLFIRTVEGDMSNLGVFPDASFDLIFHPVSNTFVPDVRIVWKEASRVIRKGGTLLSAFTNPAVYLFDWELAMNTGKLHVKYKLPYADVTDLEESEKQIRLAKGAPMEFSHTLSDQIGGQIDAGFVITGFYEDREGPEDKDPVSPYMANYIATRAVKL
jgi:ubiquinone/menaquinone biosynthesis C-methylase UbiE